MQASQTIPFLFCLFVLICLCEAGKMMVGGASEVKSADADAQKIAESVKEELQKKIGGMAFTEFKLMNYRSQVVAGTNYFMKIDVGNDKYIHIRVFVPLPHTGEKASLHSYEEHKTLDDPINYF